MGDHRMVVHFLSRPLVSRTAAKLIDSNVTLATAGAFPMTDEASPSDGGCTCRFMRYRMTGTPLFVHCCHCRWCQRETGTAFALNAMIESERVRYWRAKRKRLPRRV